MPQDPDMATRQSWWTNHLDPCIDTQSNTCCLSKDQKKKKERKLGAS